MFRNGQSKLYILSYSKSHFACKVSILRIFESTSSFPKYTFITKAASKFSLSLPFLEPNRSNVIQDGTGIEDQSQGGPYRRPSWLTIPGLSVPGVLLSLMRKLLEYQEQEIPRIKCVKRPHESFKTYETRAAMRAEITVDASPEPSQAKYQSQLS